MNKPKIKTNEAKRAGETIQEQEFIESTLALLALQKEKVLFFHILSNVQYGGRVGLVERALAFHQCGPGSISAPGVIRGLSLLVLNSAMRGFPPGKFRFFPSHQKQHLI